MHFNLSKKRLIRILSVIGILFALQMFTYFLLTVVIYPSEKLTPLLVKKANTYLDADVDCKQVKFTFLQTFPHFGLSLREGIITTRDSATFTNDTILAFDQCIVSLNTLDLLLRGRIMLNEVSILTPKINLEVDKAGAANWLFIESDTTTVSSDSDFIPDIAARKIRIKDGSFHFIDAVNRLDLAMDGFNFIVDGLIEKGTNRLNLEAGADNIFIEAPDMSIRNHLHWNLESELVLANHYRKITLTDTKLLVNALPFSLNATLERIENTRIFNSAIDFGITTPSISSLIELLPDSIIPFVNRKSIQGELHIDGSWSGKLGEGILPCLKTNVNLQNVGFTFDNGYKINKLALKSLLHIDPQNTEPSFFKIEELSVKGNDISIDMQGEIADLITEPSFDGGLKGNINFTELAKAFELPDSIFTMGGTINANLTTQFAASDIQTGNFGRIKANGAISIKDFVLEVPQDSIDVYISSSEAVLRSQVRNQDLTTKSGLLSGNLSIDSLNLNWGHAINTNIANMQLEMQAPPTLDTTSVIPIRTLVSYEHLETTLPDSAWVKTGRSTLELKIQPSPKNKKIPVITGLLNSNDFIYRIRPINTVFALKHSTFNITASHQEWLFKQAERKITLSDSARKVMIDSLAKQNKGLLADKDAARMLRRWDVRGSVHFDTLKAYSAYFPTLISMDKTAIKFNPDEINLDKAKVMIGSSDLTLTGDIHSIRKALLRGGVITGDLKVTSDFIDCNELIRIINRGLIYAEDKALPKTDPGLLDAESTVQLARSLPTSAEVDSTTSELLVIPDYLDIKLLTKAKRIEFSDLLLDNVEGLITIKDEAVHLNNLNMHSNMGCAQLSMVYTCNNRLSATTGFDLTMEDVVVDKLLGLYPTIDTLIPMLRSFEGMLNCSVAAQAKLDSTMSIELPSLNAACSLSGRNLVLLDGEAFAEISKKLMFKNKKRNVIDSMYVDLIIKDNQIEVFPFLLEMDRYKAAVGGTHNLDMTFNYHISVLKSPVPFKLGIDVSGNMDDFKYKITSPKYKDLFKPSKKGEFSQAPINLRQSFYEALRESLNVASKPFVDKIGTDHTDSKKAPPSTNKNDSIQ
ncbi:MAG TPA: hypothetical protein DCF91_02465 [Porphyromonadaceae bacterium]|nr:hypothetical protein [Porphyromonadaceae bacterium]